MDTTKIIKGVVNSGRYTVTAPIIKEDYGLYLQIEGVELPQTYEVDFSNSEHSGTSVTMIGNSDGVLIPHQFIDTGKDVFAFLYHVGANYGRTVYKFRIPNKVRPDRTDDTPTPEQASVIDQAISALNTAVAQTAEDVASADQSAQDAKDDADRAERARTGAETAQRKAEEAQESAERAKGDAETSERNASESERNAKRYSETASEKADSIHSMTAQATTLPDWSSATASYDAETGVMSFGIPKGKDGTNGTDGYSPTAYVSKSGKVATITITDENGTTSTQVKDGEDGTNGIDGISPSVSVTDITGGHRIVITDEDGAKSFDVEDGATGATPNLTIGTVETLEPTEPATATITGTPENPVLNLGLPQGEQGEVTTEEFLKAFVTDSVSGAIASFPDGADDIPLKSLVVDIDPIQDLHGYDSPWPAGGGKNLLDPSLLKTQAAWNTINMQLKPNTAYTMSSNCPSTSGLMMYFTTDGLQPSNRKVSRGYPVTQTSDENGIIKVIQRRASGEESFSDYQFQVEEGSTATDYAPYENICPISGWEGMNVAVTGANIWGGEKMADDMVAVASAYDPSAVIKGEDENGRYVRIPARNAIANKIVFDRFKDNERYTFILKVRKADTSEKVNIIIAYTDGTYTACSIPTTVVANTAYTYAVVSTAGKTVSAIKFSWQGVNTYLYYDDSGIFEGVLTASDFESFGQVIPINWQTEAGTVYGGKLDVLRGKLTVYPYYASYNGETLTGRWISDRDVYAVGTTPTIGAQVVNIGAQGTEYQLEAHDVASLLGQNNIFADTGDCSVEYRADTKLFINRLTEPDADMIADSNIVSGQYFMVGNNLYKATVNIASGAQIVVGTNATKVSLSEALNQIKEA